MARGFPPSFKIKAVLWPARESLESDDAAQAGDRKYKTVVIGAHRLGLDRVEIERRQTATQNVDQAGVGGDSEMLLIDQVVVLERSSVSLTDRTELSRRRQHPKVVHGIVGDEEVDVLGGANKAIGDYRESADDDEAGSGGDHRPGGDVQFRVVGQLHGPGRSPAPGERPAQRAAVRGAATLLEGSREGE